MVGEIEAGAPNCVGFGGWQQFDVRKTVVGIGEPEPGINAPSDLDDLFSHDRAESDSPVGAKTGNLHDAKPSDDRFWADSVGIVTLPTLPRKGKIPVVDRVFSD